MQSLGQKQAVRQFVKFAIVGVISTIIDWGAFFIFDKLGLFYLFAKFLSFLLSVINSFIFNRSWTFRSDNSQKLQEFSKFMIVSIIGLGINEIIFYLAVSKLHFIYLYSLILATAITLIWNFLANKKWTFKS